MAGQDYPDSGLSVSEIAARLGVDRRSIAYLLRRDDAKPTNDASGKGSTFRYDKAAYQRVADAVERTASGRRLSRIARLENETKLLAARVRLAKAKTKGALQQAAAKTDKRLAHAEETSAALSIGAVRQNAEIQTIKNVVGKLAVAIVQDRDALRQLANAINTLSATKPGTGNNVPEKIPAIPPIDREMFQMN